jgi:hypothetical protein
MRPRASDRCGMKKTRALASKSKKPHQSYLNADALVKACEAVGRQVPMLNVKNLCYAHHVGLSPCFPRHEITRICTEALRFGAHRREENSELKTNLYANSPIHAVPGPLSPYRKHFREGVRLGPGIRKTSAQVKIQANRPGNPLYLQSLTSESPRMPRLPSTFTCRVFVPKKPKATGMGGFGVHHMTMYSYDLTAKHASE